MKDPGDTTIADRELERQGRRLATPSIPFLLVALVLFVPGIVLVIVAGSWAWALGIVLVALSLPAATVAVAAVLSSAVARWAARHRSFA
jgi:hypothetical protein